MEQTQESTSEAKSESGGGVLLIGQSSVVQGQFVQGDGQVLVVVGGHGIDRREDDRPGFLVSRERFASRLLPVGDGVADRNISHRLDTGDDVAHRSGLESWCLNPLELQQTHFLHDVFLVGVHEADPLSWMHSPFLDSAEHHGPAIGIVLGVEDEGL